MTNQDQNRKVSLHPLLLMARRKYLKVNNLTKFADNDELLPVLITIGLLSKDSLADNWIINDDWQERCLAYLNK